MDSICLVSDSRIIQAGRFLCHVFHLSHHLLPTPNLVRTCNPLCKKFVSHPYILTPNGSQSGSQLRYSSVSPSPIKACSNCAWRFNRQRCFFKSFGCNLLLFRCCTKNSEAKVGNIIQSVLLLSVKNY